jgi:hypothetical protein
MTPLSFAPTAWIGCRSAHLVFVNLLPGNPLRHGLFGGDRDDR